MRGFTTIAAFFVAGIASADDEPTRLSARPEPEPTRFDVGPTFILPAGAPPAVGAPGVAPPQSGEAAPQLDGPIPKSFDSVYGPVEEAVRKSPVQPTLELRSLKPDGYYAVRQPANCTFPLDVVIVQDATGSFRDDYDEMRNMQLAAMTSALSSTHPGTRYGLVSFKDKPIRTLGEAYDYCHRYDLALNKGGFQPLFDAYGKLWSNGGQDPAENQFGAIIAALQSTQVGWQTNSLASKLIVVSTDAWPHFADDGLNKAEYEMSPNTGVLDADEAHQCRFQYYPAPEQVRTVMKQAGAYGAFLVFDGNYANGLVKKSWEWFNGFIGQPAEFVEPLANDSSNFWDILAKSIKAIENEECVYTTAAPVPTTTATVQTTAAPVPTTEAPVPTTAAPVSTTAASVPTTAAPVPTTAVTVPSTAAPVSTTSAPVPTTAAPVPTTAAPVPTTFASIPSTFTEAPTDVIVTQVGSTEPEEPSVPCVPGHPCPCPEVVIKLRHRPAQLHLLVSNEPNATVPL